MRGPGEGHDRMAVGAEGVGGGTSLDVTESDLAFFPTNCGSKKSLSSITNLANIFECFKYSNT